MTINYTTLVAAKTTAGSIQSWIRRDTVPSTDIVVEAEAWIYNRLRVREMLTTSAAQTLSANASTLALPSGYQETKHFMIVAPDLVEVGLLPIERWYEHAPRESDGILSTGLPLYAHDDDGSNLNFNVKAEQAYTYDWTYYATPTALSSAETNFLTTRLPSLLRYACLMFACEHERMDEDVVYHSTKAMAEIAEANRAEDRRKQGMAAAGSVPRVA